MKRWIVSTVIGTVGMLSQASRSAAEPLPLWPRFSVGLGGYILGSDDKIAVDAETDVLGTNIQLDRDLGLPDSKSVLNGDLRWAFADRHSLAFRYYQFDRASTRSLERDLEFGGVEYPLGARVDSTFDTTSIEAVYDYWFLRRDELGVAASLGVAYLALDASLTGTVTAGSAGVSETRRTEASTDLPVPMIGLEVKGSPTSRLVLYAGARYLPEVTVGDYTGEAASYDAGIEVFFYGPLAAGAGFTGSFYKADVDNDDWHGSVDLITNGWTLYLRASF